MAITDELFHHTKLYHKTLAKFCNPLEERFGITDVAIHFVSNNGLINIHTNKKWMEHCMEKEYFKEDEHITNSAQIRTGFTICAYHPSEKFTTGLLKDATSYGMHHGVDYARKTKTGYQAIAFDTTLENIEMPNKVINNQKCIIRFMDYLEKELQPIFKNLSDHIIDIDLLTSSNNTMTKKLAKQQNIEMETKIKFLKQIGIITSDFLDISLSIKEKKCLKLYLEGKTAADTAMELTMSRRTVENYMDKLKTKLNCRYKKDLFEKIDLLNCLDLLN